MMFQSFVSGDVPLDLLEYPDVGRLDGKYKDAVAGVLQQGAA